MIVKELVECLDAEKDSIFMSDDLEELSLHQNNKVPKDILSKKVIRIEHTNFNDILTIRYERSKRDGE